MTCIVGIEDPDEGVLIGGDSAGVSGWDITIRGDEKVFQRGPFVMGFTSSFRMGQLLRFKLDIPEHTTSASPLEYMCTTFVDAVRQCLKDGGYARSKDGEESGGCFLVGYRDRLYRVGSDFQVGRSTCGFDAVGCGDSYALGALASTAELRPQARAHNALHVAERFSAGVRGPFVLASTP